MVKHYTFEFDVVKPSDSPTKKPHYVYLCKTILSLFLIRY